MPHRTLPTCPARWAVLPPGCPGRNIVILAALGCTCIPLPWYVQLIQTEQFLFFTSNKFLTLAHTQQSHRDLCHAFASVTDYSTFQKPRLLFICSPEICIHFNSIQYNATISWDPFCFLCFHPVWRTCQYITEADFWIYRYITFPANTSVD